MISGKYVHLIETHWDGIISRVTDQIRREPELKHLPAIIEAEARDWGEDLLQQLGHWLVTSNQQDVTYRYERLGRTRFEQGIPLHESVRVLCIIREKTLDFVEEHIVSTASVELYAEEELERRLGRFFDTLLVSLVRGYESAMRRSAVIGAH
jgi:hypothetical protein